MTRSEKKESDDMIRQPIITVLGHVDHGKTSLLDAIRNSRVAAKEPGAITQHIGATEVPVDAVEAIAGSLIKKFGFTLTIPGLLCIDTPGHEAFTNLRKRGGSIADLAILVVDVMQGIQPQTAEAIEILRAYKVPFVIAMNKIDSLSFYASKEGSFLDNQKNQSEKSKQLLDEKLYLLVGALYKYGFEGERFDRCVFGKQIPIVPCSAKTKEGLPELLTLLAGLSQKYLETKLNIAHDEAARGAVLEAKEEKGLGKTLDVILYQGSLSVNDEIAVIGKNGIIRAKIRALLQPKPMQEMRSSKEKFAQVKKVYAASGIKINAPGLDDVLAGSSLVVVKTGEEIRELENEIKEISFTSAEKGLIVKTDAIGSLEAMIELLKKAGYVVRKADVGNINRKDVMEAASMLCQDPLLGCVLGFNVTVDKEAEKEAEERGVRIFNEKVIYKLIDDYKLWVDTSKKASRDKEIACLVWPVEFEILRGKTFRNNKPAIVGVRVIDGRLKEGWRVMNKDGVVIGKITGMQNNGEAVLDAKKGDELAIAIDHANVGRNVHEGEHLFSCIPMSQYCDLLKYKDEFTEEEKELLEMIRVKRSEEEGEKEGEI
ncbi:MAG: translation initiation factor IF-2 [archaeon]|mgnify:CR=1 FL=1